MQTSQSETCPLPRRDNFLALMRWEYLHEDAREVPLHLLAPAERELKIGSFQVRVDRREDLDRWLREEIAPDLKKYDKRRRAEHAIADYLDRHARLPEIVEKLRVCRMHGDLGAHRDEEGTHRIIMWHSKCGNNRLCPDEAREEQMRLAEKYVPVIERWKKEHYGRQVQYAVLTWPNVAPGDLAEKKRAMFKHLAKWLKLKINRSVKGCLAVQEDPLAADGSWNLHINLILLVQGRFDWSDARAAWFKATRHLFHASHRDFQVYFRDVTRGNLARAVLELVKYSAKHITEGHDDDGDNLVREPDPADPLDTDPVGDGLDPRARESRQAPGLIHWPIERFDEWHAAGLRFRRTRSYGALFAVEEVEPEKIDQSKVQWIGSIDYEKATGYAVTITDRDSINLIPDHNSRATPDHKSGGRGSGPPN